MRPDITELSEDEALSEAEGFVQEVVLASTRALPYHVDRDPLVNAGRFGFVDALRRYRPDAGASFRTYAALRIRGAVYDELRRINPFGRSRLETQRDLERSRERLEHEYGRVVDNAELLDHLKVVGQRRLDYEHLLCNETVSMEVLNELAAEDGRPDHRCEIADMQDVVIGNVCKLRDDDQLVLALYYLDGKTLSEIARFFDVTESRICQRHAEIIKKLRKLSRKQLSLGPCS